MEAQTHENNADLHDLCEDLDANTEDIAIEFFTGEFDYESLVAEEPAVSSSLMNRVAAWLSIA